jgi:ribosomal protein S18 acetylase RimI-like enzyme
MSHVPELTFTLHDRLPADEARRIDAGLDESNLAAAPLHEVRPLACFARDVDGAVVGGAIGRTWGTSAELQQLWVAPALRRHGIGTRLVCEFESAAAARGCCTVLLETFSFQNPDLYRALGYRAIGELPVYPHGIVKYVMARELPGESERKRLELVASVLWRRLDQPGHDAARLERRPDGWRLAGTALLQEDARPCRLDYEVHCDANWHTRSALVAGWIGAESVCLELSTDGTGHWQLNGAAQPQVAGCLDLDLAFTPATNTLPIRRLNLEIGAAAPVPAAWLRFPKLTLEQLEQVYTRTGEREYRYESDGGRFVAPLSVSDAGLITRYGELWQAESELPRKK